MFYMKEREFHLILMVVRWDHFGCCCCCSQLIKIAINPKTGNRNPACDVRVLQWQHFSAISLEIFMPQQRGLG